MSHHTAVFAVNIGQTVATQLPAVTDQILPQDGSSNYLPQANLSVIMAALMSATMDRGQIVSPPYRQIALPYIYPVIEALNPPNIPAILDLSQNPLRVSAQNPFGVTATSDLAMGNERATAVINLRDNYIPAPVGDVYTLRATGTTTLVANAWTSVPLTFDQPIIQGRYSVLGGDVISLHGCAWRLTMDGYFFRPGGLCATALGNRSPAVQYWGNWGEWGQFQNTSLPRLEVFATAADTAQTLFLQVVKIA
jgi:hypothetical protein